MKKILIDTNIFIYALDADSNFHQKSVTILSHKTNYLFTSTKNISEYFAVTSKLNINESVILDFYSEIKENIEITYPSDKSLLIFEDLIRKYKASSGKGPQT